MDKATKLRIRALGLGFLCALACIPIVMVTHWIVRFVAYFPIYHGSKIFCRKVLKIELPDEAFIDSSTLAVEKMTSIEEKRAEKAKKVIRQISYIMAAFPFALLFGLNLLLFFKLGTWSNKTHWEIMIAPSIFLFVLTKIIGFIVTSKVLGIKHLQIQNSETGQIPQNNFSNYESPSVLSSSDPMNPANLLGVYGPHSALNPNRDD